MGRRDKTAEVLDAPNVLETKCQKLAKALRSAKCPIVYTGAGISTAASIPDYRGPNGVWTLAGKGVTNLQSCDPVDADPTVCHLALRELYKKGLVKHVLSQNCDGLHLRSGLPQKALSEIHGNMFVEVCTHCKPQRQFIRPFDVTDLTRFRRHETARQCNVCFSPLQDTIVHFGEHGKLRWPLNWEGVLETLKTADLILCLGSSLQILKKYKFLWAQDRPPRMRPKLKIVNLQWTPLDRTADLKINGKCDVVMKRVLEILNLRIPTYCRLCDPVLNSRHRNARNKEVMDKLTECVCPEIPAKSSNFAALPVSTTDAQEIVSADAQAIVGAAGPSSDRKRKCPGWWTAGLHLVSQKLPASKKRRYSRQSSRDSGIETAESSPGASAAVDGNGLPKRKRGRPPKLAKKVPLGSVSVEKQAETESKADESLNCSDTVLAAASSIATESQPPQSALPASQDDANSEEPENSEQLATTTTTAEQKDDQSINSDAVSVPSVPCVVSEIYSQSTVPSSPSSTFSTTQDGLEGSVPNAVSDLILNNENKEEEEERIVQVQNQVPLDFSPESQCNFENSNSDFLPPNEHIETQNIPLVQVSQIDTLLSTV